MNARNNPWKRFSERFWQRGVGLIITEVIGAEGNRVHVEFVSRRCVIDEALTARLTFYRAGGIARW